MRITQQDLRQPIIHLFGFKKYNGTKCAVAEFDLNDSNLVTQIWVDCKKVTLLRTINKGLGDNGEEYEIVENYAATYDIVTDKDVEMPDITGYNLI